MKELFFKNMHVYNLHRSNQLDHENGRPAILLWFKYTKSLLWLGTSNKDNKSKEKPLIVFINNRKTYFYSTGIERVESKYLIGHWIDYSNKNKSNEAKAYKLSNSEQQQLISKFVTFTSQKDPYLKIQELEQEVQKLKTENELLKQSNLKNRNRG